MDSAQILGKYSDPMPGHETPYYYEEMKISFASNFINLSFDHMTGLSALGRKFKDTGVCPIFNSERNKIEIIDGFSDSQGHKIGSTEVMNYYSSYKIGENTFQNVMAVQVKDFGTNKTINLFLVKNVGTVEFQIINNSDTLYWTLNNWFINK